MRPESSLPHSWVHLTSAPDAVLGPFLGHEPSLSNYRISAMHIAGPSLWLFGAVIDLPSPVNSSGERNGLRKFNLALHVSVERLISWSGMPALDPQHDDSMHGFELTLPVEVALLPTDQSIGELRLLAVSGTSPHLSFEVSAFHVEAFGGKHAAKRFTDAFRVRP